MSPAPTEEQTKSANSINDVISGVVDQLGSRNIQIALFLALALSVGSVFIMNGLGGVTHFRGLIEGAGPWAPLVFVILKASTYVIAPLSGTPLKLVAGALFGFWDGALYALAGDVLGACLNFWIARLLRVKAIARLAGKKTLVRIDEVTAHVGGWKALLVARLLLSSLYDFISYAAGLSNLRFRHFFWVTLLAGIPSSLVTAFVGDSFVSNQGLFLGLVGLSAAVLIGMVLGRKWSAKIR